LDLAGFQVADDNNHLVHHLFKLVVVGEAALDFSDLTVAEVDFFTVQLVRGWVPFALDDLANSEIEF
jgi:hypothetical protein